MYNTEASKNCYNVLLFFTLQLIYIVKFIENISIFIMAKHLRKQILDTKYLLLIVKKHKTDIAQVSAIVVKVVNLGF